MGATAQPASPALPETTFRLNNCDLAVRGSAIPDAAFLSRCFNWAGRRKGSFSERKASPRDRNVLAELPCCYLKRESKGEQGGAEKERKKLGASCQGVYCCKQLLLFVFIFRNSHLFIVPPNLSKRHRGFAWNGGIAPIPAIRATILVPASDADWKTALGSGNFAVSTKRLTLDPLNVGYPQCRPCPNGMQEGKGDLACEAGSSGDF